MIFTTIIGQFLNPFLGILIGDWLRCKRDIEKYPVLVKNFNENVDHLKRLLEKGKEEQDGRRL